jgi:hypothetical protein
MSLTLKENATTSIGERLVSLLNYVEQVVRLDERSITRLEGHRLPNGQTFSVHQHELFSLPGFTHDTVDDDGPIWLKIERPRRGTPPSPPEEITDWVENSPDPDRKPVVRKFVIETVSETSKASLIADSMALETDFELSPDNSSRWNVRLRLEMLPVVERVANKWIETTWLQWAVAEKPVRKSLALYQRFFEIAQMIEIGTGGSPLEIVWGIGVNGGDKLCQMAD